MDYEKAYKKALKRAKAAMDIAADKDLVEGVVRTIFHEFRESEEERIIKTLQEYVKNRNWPLNGPTQDEALAYLEKQKENPKNADSIPADCVSDAKCEDRWHKVEDSLPDNGRLVLAQDNLGNRLLARYDGEGNWEVSVYDNEDYYCRNTITKWCEIPSEKQKEQKPVDYDHEMWKNCEANFEGGKKEVIEHPEKYGLCKPSEWSEEDERILKGIIGLVDHDQHYGVSNKEMLAWLKSLSPSWKPSEEQMSMLLAVINDPNNAGAESCQMALKSLYEHLKKLK